MPKYYRGRQIAGPVLKVELASNSYFNDNYCNTERQILVAKNESPSSRLTGIQTHPVTR